MTTIISNAHLSATINHNGAELISLINLKTPKEYIWEGNPEFWAKHSPILFPIVGTLKNNSYFHNDEKYALTRHGFARDMIFELIHKTESKAIFSLKSNSETRQLYPFEFELQVIYTLFDHELVVTYEVFNKDNDILYYSIGGHPAFALPKRFEDYSLLFEANESLVSYLLETDLLSENSFEIPLKGNKLPLTYSLFENDALIFKKLKSKQITLLENEKGIVNFRFDDFPNFGIWTKNGAPFLCLEPWLGYSDVLNASGNLSEKEGIQSLESNTSKRHSFSIEIL